MTVDHAMSVFCAANTANFHCVRQIELLTRAGLTVHLVDHDEVVAMGATKARSHVRWPRSGRRSMASVLGRRIADRLADWLVKLRLKSLWRKHRPDVCHVHWVDDRVLAAADAGLRPLVVTGYGSDLNWTRLPDYDPVLLKRVRQGLSRTDLFISDSDDMIERANELAGRKLDSLLLPLGIDTALFSPAQPGEAATARRRFGLPLDGPVIFSPRLIRPNYRQADVVRAFSASVRGRGLDAHLVLKSFHSHPPTVEEIRGLVEALGLSDRVTLLDEVDYEELPLLYKAADLVVNYPELDAFPVTFLEAGACAVPILTNRLPAYASNGMAPFLNFLAAEEEAKLAAEMARLCRDPAALARGSEARDHVVRHFDERHFVQALTGAYARLAATR